MILIDTSVIIDISRGNDNHKVLLFRKIVDSQVPYGISVYTYTEVLQGVKNERESKNIEEYLSSCFTIYYLPNRIEVYESAAKMYYDLRKKGKTIRNTIDILIAKTAIINDFYLLHNDRDFDIIAEVIPDLKIFNNWAEDKLWEV